MALTPEQFKDLTQKIINSKGDQGTVTDLLTQLSDHNSEVLSIAQEARTKAQDLEQLNNTLRDTNHKLFLRVGEVPAEKQPEQAEPEKELKYEDLFDEKGFLK